MFKVGDIITIVLEDEVFHNKVGVIIEVDNSDVPCCVDIAYSSRENPVWFKAKEIKKVSNIKATLFKLDYLYV